MKQITLRACGGAHDGEPGICAKRHFEASCPAASAVIFQHSPARTIRALASSHASVRSIEALANGVRRWARSSIGGQEGRLMRVSGSELALRASRLATALLGLGVSVAQAADPVGTWLVPNGDAIVRIADCASLQAAPGQPRRTLPRLRDRNRRKRPGRPRAS